MACALPELSLTNETFNLTDIMCISTDNSHSEQEIRLESTMRVFKKGNDIKERDIKMNNHAFFRASSLD
jgi:hypothetical protein